MINNISSDFKKNLSRYIVTLIHFVASFWYERFLFIFSEDRSVVLSIAKNNIVSDHFEFVEGYIFSKLFGLIFIYLFWRIIYYAYDNINKTIIIHMVVFVIGLIVLFITWPTIFTSSADNYVTYSYALRFYPEYWHSAYSSFIYAGMMMVYPHPFMIVFMQWLLLISATTYLSVRIEKSGRTGGAGIFVPYLMIIVPEWFSLASNAYRTEQYAVLCIAYTSFLVMDIVDRKERKPHELIVLLLVSALISVWRSEGIIFGFLAFLFALIFAYKLPFKKICLYMAGFLVAFVLILMPQKLGDMKYYGKDYSFINSFPTLNNILNSNDGVLTQYEGLDEDLAAIDKVCPIELIRMYGMEGYRRYNYANGRRDINQSLCDDETAANYMSAYYRLVMHNFMTYFKTQASMLFNISGIKDVLYIEGARNMGEWQDLPPYTYDGWGYGIEDMSHLTMTHVMQESETANFVASIILDTIATIRKILRLIYIRTFMVMLLPIMEIIIFMSEFIKLCRKKDHLQGLAGFSMALLGQAVAIGMVMPAAVIAYFHAYLYSSFVVVAVFCIITRKERLERRLPIH